MESILNSLKISNVLNPRGFRIPNCDRKGFYKKKQVTGSPCCFISVVSLYLVSVPQTHTHTHTPADIQIDPPHAWTLPKNPQRLIPTTHTYTIPLFCSPGCLDSHINTILSEWLITMYYSSKCTPAVWLMPHRKWSRSGVFVGVWCGRVWGVGM